MINHIIISRMAFTEKDLMMQYLPVTKERLIPALKSQTDQGFKFGIIMFPEDVEVAKEYIDIDFIPFFSYGEYYEYVLRNEVSVQTRHDIDDYMSENYVQEIHRIYEENREKYGSFIIHAQPTKLDLRTGQEVSIDDYTPTRTSMFLTLCQNPIKNSVYDKQHGEMYELAERTILLPEGYTKWIIHGNNITCKRGMA